MCIYNRIDFTTINFYLFIYLLFLSIYYSPLVYHCMYRYIHTNKETRKTGSGDCRRRELKIDDSDHVNIIIFLFFLFFGIVRKSKLSCSSYIL